MEVKGHRTLGLGVFKILNKQNLAFTEEIFRRTKWLTHRPNNIQVNVHIQPNVAAKVFGIHSQNI